MLATTAPSDQSAQQQKSPLLSRFMDKVATEPSTGCWLWTGALSSDGYGSFRAWGKAVLAHRFSYEAFRGALPPYPQYEADHVCRVRSCVNPFHLEFVKHHENVKRGNLNLVAKKVSGSKTHCKFGHEYTKENTYLFMRSHGLQRQCVICRKAASDKSNAKKKLAKSAGHPDRHP